MKHKLNLFLIGILLFASCSNSVKSNEFKNINLEIGNNSPIEIPVNYKIPNSSDPVILSKTYGYLKGQKFTLDRIRKEFPEFEIEVLKCELEFNLSFKNGSDRIFKELKVLFGDEFEKYDNQMMNKMEEMLSNQEISEELALGFIDEVRQRAKGNIESPILETLLTYQFIDNPSKEFSDGFTKEYSTKNHPKTKGVIINAKLPISWAQKEGDRPNVIQKFISENGHGLEFILLMVKDLGLPSGYEVTDEELNEFFKESELKKTLPEGSEFISAKSIMVDNYKGSQIIFKASQQRLDFSFTTKSVHFITIYNGKIIFLQCHVFSEDENNLDGRFDLFFPLFRQIANTLILMNQYEPTNSQVDYLRIPLINNQGAYVLKGVINNSSIDFILDTGASESMISKKELSRITRNVKNNTIDLEGGIYTLADGSKVYCDRVSVGEMKIGDYTIKNITFAIMPDEGNNLLGKNVLDKFQKWTIDKNKNELKLY